MTTARGAWQVSIDLPCMHSVRLGSQMMSDSLKAVAIKSFMYNLARTESRRSYGNLAADASSTLRLCFASRNHASKDEGRAACLGNEKPWKTRGARHPSSLKLP